uniref:Uncharacterized protein n=1 Tax=Kwoniella dejecticola CBS 10117 TaxID=1296121 RepID=A0A1A6A2C3_9TREE|nr:uncharacterized protein I303_05065 [Kwoniella dejecticola CBS 10117]OBR84208.1 hypothetical protein I303_05065 [Kwoniella dejecticola CBS 10117]
MSGKGIDPVGNPRDAAITIGPFKPSRPGYGPVLSYLQAAQLDTPLKIHPLLQLRTWDPKPYPKYLAWNVIEHPMFAAIWVDYDDTETVSPSVPLAPPYVTLYHLLKRYLRHEYAHVGMDQRTWSASYFADSRRAEYRACGDWLVYKSTKSDGYNIYDFFASPLYVDELGEMHPRAVRIMEQQYFEKRRMGFFDLMEGYRKSDALLGATYYDGIHNDQESVERLKKKYNFHSANLLLLRLGNC